MICLYVFIFIIFMPIVCRYQKNVLYSLKHELYVVWNSHVDSGKYIQVLQKSTKTLSPLDHIPNSLHSFLWLNNIPQHVCAFFFIYYSLGKRLFCLTVCFYKLVINIHMLNAVCIPFSSYVLRMRIDGP